MNSNIRVIDWTRKVHAKASEEYISVEFKYGERLKKVWVPVKYRRTGVDLQSREEVEKYLDSIYDYLNPDNVQKWKKTEEEFWKREKPNADTTKSFFDALGDCEWHCRNCSLPQNPNFARRIQDLKEFGYTLATDTARFCPKCKTSCTHLIMLNIPRVVNAGNGYETWSPKLRQRIIKVLGGIDVYENRALPSCLPDHKFSEIRWDENVKETNDDNMSETEIRAKFQLLSNQRNQQKREVCRHCYQTGERGIIYGIPFFYKGSRMWDKNIPTKGKLAEKGCEGCPWYDIEKWRSELLKKL